MRILVLTAHADDEVLGVGGTIARHVEDGDRVRIATATDCRPTAPGRTPERRRKELIESLKRLGVEDHIAIGMQAMAIDTTELGAIVATWVRDTDAEIVYTHHPGDLNRDHGAVAEAVKVACRTTAAPPRRLCFFETPSSSEFGGPFVPNVFVELTQEQFDKKLQALLVYESEMRPFPHPRSIEALTARARYWGQIAGFELAEPFILHRELISS